MVRLLRHLILYDFPSFLAVVCCCARLESSTQDLDEMLDFMQFSFMKKELLMVLLVGSQYELGI